MRAGIERASTIIMPALFLILVAVDVMMGPLITLFIFNRAKPLRELRLDLVVVGALQLAALAKVDQPVRAVALPLSCIAAM